MQRVASVKSVSQEKKEDEGGDTRGPESVERIWTEEVDGAWAPGKAPVHLLTAFLQYVQEDDVEHAEVTAREILGFEPQNKLVQDLLEAMKQRDVMEAELESESEEDEEEEDEEESSGESEDEHDDEEDPQSGEEKTNEEK